jgi:hypothetical protein
MPKQEFEVVVTFRYTSDVVGSVEKQAEADREQYRGNPDFLAAELTNFDYEVTVTPVKGN